MTWHVMPMFSTDCAKEVMWFRTLFTELSIPRPHPGGQRWGYCTVREQCHWEADQTRRHKDVLVKRSGQDIGDSVGEGHFRKESG